MEFKNYTRCDRAAFLSFYSLKSKAVERRYTMVKRVLIALAGMAALPYGVLRAQSGKNGGIPILVGALCIVLALFHDQINSWSAKRSMVKGAEEIDYLFSEDSFFERSRAGKMTHSYAAVRDFYLHRGYFVLFLDQDQSCIVDEGGFGKGSAEEFRSFVEEKTGKKLKYIQ